MDVLLIVYDNDSYIHSFPLGIGYLASALRNAGHRVVIYNQDQYHYPESHLTEYLTRNHFDVVGLGIVAGYYQTQSTAYPDALSTSSAVTVRLRNRSIS